MHYVFNAPFYKKIDLSAVVYNSVRVEGKKYISIGKKSTIQRLGWLLALKVEEHDPELNIGANCAIGDFCHITAIRKVIIEDDVLMANKVYISDNVHEYQDINVPVIRQGVLFKGEVRIKSGAWIGENVCIIGASIGKNSIIGANAVVTKDIPDYAIAVGSPARVIKQYDTVTNQWITIK